MASLDSGDGRYLLQPSVYKALTKLHRALEHIDEFEDRVAELEANAQMSFKFDRRSLRVEACIYAPEFSEHGHRLSAVVGDAVQNLRASLNYLVTALVAANQAELVKHHAFPIYLDQKKFSREVGCPDKPTGQLQGIKLGFEVIEKHQPFTRGAAQPIWNSVHDLAVLARLSNADKHLSALQVLPTYWPSGSFDFGAANIVHIRFRHRDSSAWLYEDDSRRFEVTLDRPPDVMKFNGTFSVTTTLRPMPRDGEPDTHWDGAVLRTVWTKVEEVVSDVASIVGEARGTPEDWVRSRK